jgi:hypothetical protein
MFEVSHRLIGIYKVANATKSEYTPFLHLVRDFLMLTVRASGVSIDNFALNAPALPQAPAPAPGSQACPPSTIRPASSVKFASSVKPRSTSVRA